MTVEIRVDPFPSGAELTALLADAFADEKPVLPDLSASLGHVGAFDGGTLVGFANIAWDGGQHAFLVDVCVVSRLQGAGIGQAMVGKAVALARERGARWLHVDFLPEREVFYNRCGFRPTRAGLIDLSR